MDLSSKQYMFRILIMDDEEQYLNLYREAFSKDLLIKRGCEGGHFPEGLNTQLFDITYCNQSQDAVDCAADGIRQERPYAVAFLDIRMLSNEDGVWVGEKIRQVDPNIELVFVTGYSDYAPEDILARVLPPYKLLYVQKPFSIFEILHLAYTLSCKWDHEKELFRIQDQLEDMVKDRTLALADSKRKLEKEVKERHQAEQELMKEKQLLEERVLERTRHLDEVNGALRVLLQQRESDKKQQGDSILANVKELVTPIIRQLKATGTSKKQEDLLAALESNLEAILSPFLGKLNPQFLNLTPMEIQVANFVKNGLSNKEMADILGIAKGTVLVHRHHLREKLGLKNKKINLRTHLLSLE